MASISRLPHCQACRDLDSSCPICEPTRAGIAHRQARRDEAREWIMANLAQKHLGQTRICVPTSPEEFELMVMAIMAYARESKEGLATVEPVKCERFQRIEFREKETEGA